MPAKTVLERLKPIEKDLLGFELLQDVTSLPNLSSLHYN
jgi:hypothetical protein